MTVLIATGILTGLIMIAYYLKSGKPFKNALKGMISGAAALIIVHFFGNNIALDIELSLFNTCVSLILGAPGVALLALASVILV